MGRFRRLRKSDSIRRLVRETSLSADDLILPLFVIEGNKKKEAISSLPGVFRYSVDELTIVVEKFIKAGGRAAILFGVPSQKDSKATSAYDAKGVIPKAIKVLKNKFPNFLIFTDVCLCAYTDHGHCGVIEDGKVHNDKSLALLSKMAVVHAEAGADFVSPSDMMDLRVGYIRHSLDAKGLFDVGILSYAVKYSSAFYGPFREAAHSSPQFGDRKTYQMDFANSREAIKEAKQDVLEGADIIMVKPALAYLDIVLSIRQHLQVPIAAYSVSGEYAMIKAAAQKGWIDEKNIVLEKLTSMKRAGADIILTYHALEAINWMKT